MPIIWNNLLCDVLRPSGIMVQYHLETAQWMRSSLVFTYDILVLCAGISYWNYPPIRQISDNKKYKLILFVALCFSVVNPFMFVPLGFGRAFDFFIYFFMGYCIQTKRLSLPAVKRSNISIAIMLFAISFLLFMAIRTYVQVGDSIMEKASMLILKNICHTTNALSAIYLIYSFANAESVLSFLSDKPFLITLSGYCYGVYIYQQFILNIIYYQTQLPFVVNAYWLPWIATVATIVLSLLLCHFTLKTKIGRFLIG